MFHPRFMESSLEASKASNSMPSMPSTITDRERSANILNETQLINNKNAQTIKIVENDSIWN